MCEKENMSDLPPRGPGFQSPPGWHYIFSINLYLPRLHPGWGTKINPKYQGSDPKMPPRKVSRKANVKERRERRAKRAWVLADGWQLGIFLWNLRVRGRPCDDQCLTLVRSSFGSWIKVWKLQHCNFCLFVCVFQMVSWIICFAVGL